MRTRSLIRNKPHLEDSVRAQESAMRLAFDDGLVDGHRALIAGLDLPDPDDRHVLAAAIRCSAQVIVTNNLKDFPSDKLEPWDLEALTADDFLVNTFSLFGHDALRALRKVRLSYRNPPMTPAEFLLDLTRAGLAKLAAAVRRDIEFL